jgi:hypothetical protein
MNFSVIEFFCDRREVSHFFLVRDTGLVANEGVCVLHRLQHLTMGFREEGYLLWTLKYYKFISDINTHVANFVTVPRKSDRKHRS